MSIGDRSEKRKQKRKKPKVKRIKDSVEFYSNKSMEMSSATPNCPTNCCSNCEPS
jgi:hypothetical protein